MVENMHIPTYSRLVMQEVDLLEKKAEVLFPEKPSLQIKWINSINYLRGGKGWILDTFVQRKGAQ